MAAPSWIDRLALSNDPRCESDTFFGTDFIPLMLDEQTQGAKECTAYVAEFAAS